MIFRAGGKSNNVGFFPHRMANPHGEFQKMTSHRWAFPCIGACFATRACWVQPRFVQANEKDTQRPNLDKKCVAENISEARLERMTGRPIYIAYSSGQGLKLTWLK